MNGNGCLTLIFILFALNQKINKTKTKICLHVFALVHFTIYITMHFIIFTCLLQIFVFILFFSYWFLSEPGSQQYLSCLIFTTKRRPTQKKAESVSGCTIPHLDPHY